MTKSDFLHKCGAAAIEISEALFQLSDEDYDDIANNTKIIDFLEKFDKAVFDSKVNSNGN